MNDIMDLYTSGQLINQSFSSRVNFSREVANLQSTGILFTSVVSGICHMRPEVVPVTDCTLMLKHLHTKTGDITNYCYTFEEVKYETLCFD